MSEIDMNETNASGPVDRDVGRENDEPAVLGAGCGLSPPPSERERWMAAYVMRMIERGLTADSAWACCRAGADDHDYESDPRDAADEELSYWTDEGDEA